MGWNEKKKDAAESTEVSEVESSEIEGEVISSKKSEPIEIKADKDGLIPVDVKVYHGKFRFGGSWYDLKPGKHKVSKAVRDALKVRGDLG